MHRLIRYTEQLQLAGAFLHEKGPQYARLALILCDNVVELLAHEQCEMYLLKEAKGWSITTLSKAERADARGQEFVPKVNLLVKLKDVTEEQRDFATRAHTLRNECYHVAAMHQEIAWPVAWEYHELACTLFDRLRRGSFILGGADQQSETTQSLFDAAGLNGQFPGNFEESLAKLNGLLRATKPAARAPLGTMLSAAAKRRFTQLVEYLDFIAHDGLETDSHDDAIKEAYFAATLDIDALSEGLDMQQGHEGFAEFHRRREDAHAKYVPPLRATNIEKWLKRSESLAKEKSSAKAIVKYMDLRRESKDAVEYIHEMATQLDDAIQLQIDIARGK